MTVQFGLTKEGQLSTGDGTGTYVGNLWLDAAGNWQPYQEKMHDFGTYPVAEAKIQELPSGSYQIQKVFVK